MHLYFAASFQNEAKPPALVLNSLELATLRMIRVNYSSLPNLDGSEMGDESRHLSPDGRWLYFETSSMGPVLTEHDLSSGKVRELSPEGLTGNWRSAGAWIGDRFYWYADRVKGGEGTLWTVTPGTPDVGNGVPVAVINQLSGCSTESVQSLAASGDDIFLYEEFRRGLDRRNSCSSRISGGAWLLDTKTGKLIRQIAPDLHFSALLSDKETTQLYGISAEDVNGQTTRLVQINKSDGSILKSHPLDPGFWRVAMAPIKMTPSGEVTYQTTQSVP